MAKASTPTETPVASNNLRLWDILGKTDPSATKRFKRGGGFSGTAVKPMWQNKKLTELFGPAGKGWGMDKPEFQVVETGVNKEIMVYCWVSGWYIDPATPGIRDKCHVFGVGGDKIVTYWRANNGKPERWETDDEAFKKAYTDAVGNAFKFVGVAADVHMGLFDDSKYVQEREQEEQAQNDTLGQEVDALEQKIRDCTNLVDLEGAILDEARALKKQLDDSNRKGEGQKLITIYNARLARLKQPPQALADQPEAEDQEPLDRQ